MKKIKLTLISDQEHNSQIVTGFLMLRDEYSVEICNKIQRNQNHTYSLPHIVECEYSGKRIAYDTSDGYFDGIQNWVPKYDFYFKRSYSKEKNLMLFGEKLSNRVFPLGFNYFVTCKGNPYGEVPRTWKSCARMLMGRKGKDYFTPDRFKYRETGNQCVIFLTRLWQPEDYLSDRSNDQRRSINSMRVEIIRKLREELKEKFIGGLFPTEYSTRLAPDLVVPKRLVQRGNYLELMHSCDIAIGSTGLHESIGWKTGEYVAAGKAIVNERFCYEVPGDFVEGKNYLPFDSADNCLHNVRFLLEHPEETMHMQHENRVYYDTYLEPARMIERTLRIVEDTHTAIYGI